MQSFVTVSQIFTLSVLAAWCLVFLYKRILAPAIKRQKLKALYPEVEVIYQDYKKQTLGLDGGKIKRDSQNQNLTYGEVDFYSLVHLLKVAQPKAGELFIDLGGDSILATMLAMRIRKTLDIDFSLVEFYEAPTIRQQAILIDKWKQWRFWRILIGSPLRKCFSRKYQSWELISSISKDDGELSRIGTHIIQKHIFEILEEILFSISEM